MRSTGKTKNIPEVSAHLEGLQWPCTGPPWCIQRVWRLSLVLVLHQCRHSQTCSVYSVWKLWVELKTQLGSGACYDTAKQGDIWVFPTRICLWATCLFCPYGQGSLWLLWTALLLLKWTFIFYITVLICIPNELLKWFFWSSSWGFPWILRTFVPAFSSVF